METIGLPWMWAAFAGFVVVACAVDLLVLRSQGAHKVSAREAIGWSVLWVALALVFAGLLWWYVDAHFTRELAELKATEFLTGYLIEKSLSIDNVFVFLMLFTYFSVPAEQQKRVLILGVVGAIVLRAVMILIGGLLIARFHWILYLFGVFLVVTGVKMLLFANAEPDLDNNPVLRWMRGHLRLSREFRGSALSYLEQGQRWFTPLFVVMAMVAITDVIFAVDSIPAVYAITEDPFIVLTSNVFAILGLRALYFLFADLKDRFHLLTYGLGVVLTFVGAKMLLAGIWKIPVFWSLGIVGLILATSMLLSLWMTPAGNRSAPQASG